MLLRALSSISVPEKLRPVRAGVEWFYGQQVNIRRQQEFIEQEVGQYGDVAYILDVNSIGQDDFDVEEIAIRRLLDATKIFTGREVPGTCFHRSAICVAGVCVFLDILTDVSRHAEDLGRCTVIPGKIEMAGRSYGYIEDISDSELGGMEFRRCKGRSEAPDPLCSPAELTSGYETTSIAAQPAVNCLQVGILVEKASSESVLLGPSSLVQGIIEASDLVQCKHTGPKILE